MRRSVGVYAALKGHQYHCLFLKERMLTLNDEGT